MAVSLTESHRRAQLQIRARVVEELRLIWPAMDWARIDDTFPLWAASVSGLVARERTNSAMLAAAYLEAFRAQSGIPGAPVIVLAGEVDPIALETSLRVTSVISVKASSTAGVVRGEAMGNAFVSSTGAVTRIVLNGGRDTITQSVKADGRGLGWVRVTDREPCDFCQERAGEVMPDHYFRSHDHCGCAAEPRYR